MTIQEYARAVAEAVRDEMIEMYRDLRNPAGINLDAIIASVPPPAAQHHDAPTCPGWPAPMMRCRKEPHEARGGYLHAEDDDTPYYVDGLRYCGRCHHFLDEGESHRAAPAPVATPTPDIDPETERFARIGKLFCELWEAGAPWPVRHWTCDKHKVKGCLRCKATTAPEVRP